MKKFKKFLYWLPRVLAMGMIIFISLFALDVFSAGYSITEAILAFFIHLIPTYVLAIALIMAWRWQPIGGILFIVLGFLYTIMVFGKANPGAYLIISGPIFLIGLLFIVNEFLGIKK